MEQQEKTIKLWFRAKYYGYGWYPATWQGWAILALFMATLTVNTAIMSSTNPTPEQQVLFIVQTILMVVSHIIVCAVTGEKAGWRWGKKQ